MGTELTVQSFHEDARLAQQSQLALAQSVVGAFDTAIKSEVVKADIFNSMVKATSDYKQIKIDEWYKTEKLKLDYEQLAVSKLNAENELNYRKENIDARKAEAEERRREQLNRERYGSLGINIGKAASFYEDQDKQLTQIHDQQELLIKSLEAEKLGRKPQINSDGLVTGWRQVAPIANPARQAQLDAEIAKAKEVQNRAVKDRDDVRSKRTGLVNLYSQIGMASPDDIQRNFQEIQTGVPFEKPSESIGEEASLLAPEASWLMPGPNGEPPGGIQGPNNVIKPTAVIKPPQLSTTQPTTPPPEPISDKYSTEDFYNQVGMKDSDPTFVREVYKNMGIGDRELVRRQSHVPREKQLWDLVVNQKIAIGRNDSEPFAAEHYKRIKEEYEQFGGNPGTLLQVEAKASEAISNAIDSPDYRDKSTGENFNQSEYLRQAAIVARDKFFNPQALDNSGMPTPGNPNPVSSKISSIVSSALVNTDGSIAIRNSSNPEQSTIEEERGKYAKAARQYSLIFGNKNVTPEDGGEISEKLTRYLEKNYTDADLGIATGGVPRATKWMFPMLGDEPGYDVRKDDESIKQERKLAIQRKIGELAGSSNIKEAIIKLLAEKA